ncbi:MAG: phage integrase N-terminal SAM-like domain-containing protein, partial [Bacilli bacterium]
MTNDLLKVKDLLKMRGCSDRTVNNYLSCINRFKKYYNEKEDLKNLKENDILDYLKVNFIDLDFSAASININRAAIKYY